MNFKKYKILYHKQAVKALYKYDRIVKEVIEKEILSFVNYWNKSNHIKKLNWYENLYRLKVWKYRVLFKKDDDKLIVLVIKIWARWDVYKWL